MKKLLFLLLTSTAALNAQVPFEIWGATNYGGLGNGTVFRTSVGGDYHMVADFRPTSANLPVSLVEHPNGKFYGHTNQGGAYRAGSLFEYDPVTGAYKNLKDYRDTTGHAALSPLLVASNGKIYGYTQYGYLPSHQGAVFEYDLTSSAYTVLHYFNNSPGGLYNNVTKLTEVGGKLYGICSQGGISGSGGIFEIDISSGVYTDKKFFTSGVGAMRSFVDGQNGKLYSQTGSMNVLEYDYTANTYQILVPTNAAILTSGGNGFMPDLPAGFMGHTNTGGSAGFGYIYTYDLLTNSYSIIFDYPAGHNGTLKFIHGGGSKFYGITQGSGSVNGKIYQYDSITDLFTILKVLSLPEGYMGSEGDIFLGTDGHIYGSAPSGGIYLGDGVIYKLDTTTDLYTKLFDFGDYLMGEEPIMGVTPMSNDLLIGRTHYGGTLNYGTIYTVDVNTGVHTKKLNVTGANGGYGTPFIRTTSGKYYTCNINGGTSGRGSIMLYDSTLNTYTLKVSFTGTTNPGYPKGKLVYANDGMLYGTANSGGTSGHGSIFRYDPVSNILTHLFHFNSTVSGGYPVGELIQAANGKLYGITSSGGTFNNGVLFEYDITTSTYIPLHHLTSPEGHSAWSGLAETTPGVFYGVTSRGATDDGGTIFKYDATLNSFSVVYTFMQAISGTRPKGSLLYKDGMLYGITTQFGPSTYYGTMFSFDPAGSVLTVLRNMYPPSGLVTTDPAVYCHDCMQTYLTPVCATLPLGSVSIPDTVCNGGSLVLTAPYDPSITYTWYQDGVAIAASDTSTLVISGVSAASNSGSYHCEMSNGCRTGSTPADSAYIVSCTSIQSYETNVFTRVYPNPVNGNAISIECSEKITAVHISDLSGKSIKSERIDAQSVSLLDITELKSGIYFIHIETPNISIHKKLIVTK